ATMLPDDAYANAVLEFRTRDGGNYTAANNMKRMSGQAFMLNELRLSGAFGSATPRTATISGNSVLMVKNLQGQAPRLRLDATSTAGAGKYTFQIAAPIELLDDLVVEGHGTQHFIVQGGIADYDQPRSLTKTGGSMLTLSNAATFRGDAIVLGGDLNLSGPSAALNGQRLVAVGAGATLRQSDGLIRTERLAISPQGTFAFTGGTLQAASVSGELINAGGVFAGGPQVGPVSVFGDYRQSGGSLSLDIGTSSQGALFDSLQVTGAVSLGGTLAVNLFNGAGGSFIPSAGSVYQIITAGGGVSGSFDSLQLPALPSTMSWQLQMGASSVRLRVLGPPGSVAAAPFTAAGLAIWQQHYGLNGGANEAQADWDENGVGDGSDFLVWQRMGAGQLPPTGSPGLDAWRQHFGLSSGAAQSHGDWDGNGLVDGADFLIWQRLGAEAAPLHAARIAEKLEIDRI
ncbi:MAG TPA: hypothetical protein PJ982_13995, partial [Lacipirellulaceae bacterium]|nr:hypothetical protein [Lacipirellulaceae bacterium]